MLSPNLLGRLFLANVEDGAHLDVAACGFWGNCHQKVFLDVRFLEVPQTGEGEAEEI